MKYSARQAKTFLAFNRGIVSRLGLARSDIKRVVMSAQLSDNFMPRVLGSMSIRPGLRFIGPTLNHASPRFLPFVFSTDDTALIEITDLAVRVWVNDAPIEREFVTAGVVNSDFTADLSSWTDADEAGGNSSWVSGGYMGLRGDGTSHAVRRQLVVCNEPGIEHALNIAIHRGPVDFRVGSTAGGDEYFSETTLATGAHSLAFTPTSSFYVEFRSALKRLVMVDSCAIAASGIIQLTAPWRSADIGKIRYDQSADVIFLACEGYRQQKIERRSTTSWSVVEYLANDGPFRVENVSETTLTASAISGNITLTASDRVFKPTHVGALFGITPQGQTVSDSASAQDTFTNAIRVINISPNRTFSITITGTFVATINLQRSLESDDGPWVDVSGQSWTAPVATTFDDALDNQVAWYRIGVKSGNYTSGTAVMTLTYSLGSITGVVRVTDYNSPTSANAEVLTEMGATAATDVWAEGAWSDRRGWPTSVAFHEGRLAWSGKNGIWLSASDAYDSFDAQIEGDSGPIARTIGQGPVDTINWMVSLQRLMLGAEGAEWSARSTSFDEPLTVTNFNMKAVSTQGSGGVDAVKVDDRAIYVQRGGTRVFALALDGESLDYNASHLTSLAPEIGQPSIVRMAVQRQPDTRIHCVKSDGTVAILVFDRVENVVCWITASTDGEVEDVVILPGENQTEEDQVYYVVKRTINEVIVIPEASTGVGLFLSSGFSTVTFAGAASGSGALSSAGTSVATFAS